MNSLRILIVDDSVDDRAMTRRALALSADVREAGTLAETRDILADAAWAPSVILLDLGLPDGIGEHGACWDAVSEFARSVPVIVCTGQALSDCPDLPRRAREAGAAWFTSKDQIFTSPEYLIQNIDWIIRPQDKGEALDQLHQRAVRNMQPETFDPNSVSALLATMIARQNAMHLENQSSARGRQEQLDRIENQTTKTNGRVTKLERWQNGILASVSLIVGLAGLFWLGFGDELKGGLHAYLHNRPDPWTGHDMTEWVQKFRSQNDGMVIPDPIHDEAAEKP